MSDNRIKNVLDYKILIKIFGFSRPTWNAWKKENRPIVSMVEKYFIDEELEEFLNTGKIRKFDFMMDNFLKNKNENMQKLNEIFGDGFSLAHDSFHHFLFSLFVNIKKNESFSLSIFTQFVEFYFSNHHSLSDEERGKIYYQVRMRMDNILEDKSKKDYLFSLIQSDFSELLLVSKVQRGNPQFDSVLTCSFLYVGFLIFNNFEVKVKDVGVVFRLSNIFIENNFQLKDEELLKQFDEMLQK